jgi:transposase
MKSYSVDLRERIVTAVKNGAKKKATAKLFGVCLMSVVRYCAAAINGNLTPKTRISHPKKIAPEALIRDVELHPSSTNKERARRFGCCASAIQKRLAKLKMTVKKRPKFTKKGTNLIAGSMRGI